MAVFDFASPFTFETEERKREREERINRVNTQNQMRDFQNRVQRFVTPIKVEHEQNKFRAQVGNFMQGVRTDQEVGKFRQMAQTFLGQVDAGIQEETRKRQEGVQNEIGRFQQMAGDFLAKQQRVISPEEAERARGGFIDKFAPTQNELLGSLTSFVQRNPGVPHPDPAVRTFAEGLLEHPDIIRANPRLTDDERFATQDFASILLGRGQVGNVRPSNFPGIVGKIPGFRDPAELAATLGTFGISAAAGTPIRALLAAEAGGSLGALGGGEAARQVGAPPALGELAGGLSGGLGGGLASRAAGPAARAAAQNLDERLAQTGGVRGLLQEETGGSQLFRKKDVVSSSTADVAAPRALKDDVVGGGLLSLVRNRISQGARGFARGAEEGLETAPFGGGRDVPGTSLRGLEEGRLRTGVRGFTREPGFYQSKVADDVVGNMLERRGGPDFDLVVAAPKDEPLQQTLTRLYLGDVELGLREANLAFKELEDEASALGLTLSRDRTDEGLDFIEVMRGVRQPSSSEQDTIARRLFDVLADEERAMLAADDAFSERLLPNYFPQLFKNVDVDKIRLPGPEAYGPGRRTPFFLRGRTTEGGETIDEILDNLRRNGNPNADLVTYNPVHLTMLRVQEGVRYRAALKMLERAEVSGIAMPADIAPSSWRIPKVALFQRTAVPMALPDEQAKWFESLFAPSAFDSNPALNALKMTAAYGKFIKTFGGLFQDFDLSARFMMQSFGEAATTGRGDLVPRAGWGAIKAFGRAFIPGMDTRMRANDLKNPVRRALTQQGINLQGGRDIIERSMNEMVDDIGKEGFLFRTGITENVVAKRIKGVLDYFGSANYTRFHEEIVLQSAELEVQSGLRRGLSFDEAVAQAVRLTNERMSNLPQWQSIIKSANSRDLARTMFFSPAEQEGLFRTMLVRPFKSAAGARFMLGTMLHVAAWGNLIHLISTGELLPLERYKPWERRDSGGLFGSGVTYRTNFMRPDLPFEGPLGRVTRLDTLGQFDFPFRMALDPLFGTKSRLSTLAGFGVNVASPLLTGNDVKFFGGRRVRSPEDVGRFAGEQVAPIPVTSFFDEQGRIGPIGGGFQAAGINVSAEPLRDLLARKFEEIHGRPFNPEIDYLVAANTPELKPILDELNRLGIEFESEGALTQQRLDQTRTELEANMEPLAAAVLQGDIAQGPELARRYADYQKRMSGAFTFAFIGKEEPSPETPEGKALQEWRNLDPFSEVYTDPETQQVDWGAFYDEWDRLFARLPEDYQEAYKAAIRTVSPSMQEIEPQIEQAKTILQEIRDEPKWDGMSPEKSEELQDFMRHVERETRKLKREAAKQGVDENLITRTVVALQLGKLNKRNDNLAALSILHWRGRLPLNIERIQKALDNQRILTTFFPNDFDSIVPSEVERTGLIGEEEFQQLIR